MLGITKTNEDYVYVLSYPYDALVQVLGPNESGSVKTCYTRVFGLLSRFLPIVLPKKHPLKRSSL